MTAKPIIPRMKAQADVEFAVDHYASDAGQNVALGFIDALEQAYAFIGERPAMGSPRWSDELNLPGLRSKRLKGFPWLVFYRECESHVDVWRVLHFKRDMPAWIDEADDD